MFITDCSVTDYVKYFMNWQERSLLAKFRCGILQLKIETGRLNQLKVEQQLCDFCNDNEIENEEYFLCLCDTYLDLQDVIFNKINLKFEEFRNLSLEDKFVFLSVNCKYSVFFKKKNPHVPRNTVPHEIVIL